MREKNEMCRRTFFLDDGLDNVVDVVVSVFRNGSTLVDDSTLFRGVGLR